MVADLTPSIEALRSPNYLFVLAWSFFETNCGLGVKIVL